MHLYGAIHVSADECEPSFHCEHDDGEITVSLGDNVRGLDVVLTGTPESIARLSGALQAVVEYYVREAARVSLEALQTAVAGDLAARTPPQGSAWWNLPPRPEDAPAATS